MNALHIIKSGKVRIGWVIARVREKISVPRHTLKAGGHTRLLGTSKSGRLEITEDSITGLSRHSVDMGASVPTYSSIKSEVIQPARTVSLDGMTRNTRSFAAEFT